MPAAIELAQTRGRLAAAEQQLALAIEAIAHAERRAGAEWTGGNPPAGLHGAHLRRSTAESLLRVSSQGVGTAETCSWAVTEAARKEYATGLEAAEREAVARLRQVGVAGLVEQRQLDVDPPASSRT